MEREALVMSPSLFAHTSERQVYNYKSKCNNIIAIKNMEKKYSSKNYQLSGFFG